MKCYKKINILIYIFIFSSFYNYAEANTIFPPNQIPNIDYIPLNQDILNTNTIDQIDDLKNSRLFILYAYEDFKLEKNIQCSKINPVEYKKNINKIMLELEKYKRNFFNQINFNYLVLCKKLYINNFLTAGIPNNKVSTLIFDISLDADKISRSLHHEIFHMIKEDDNYQSMNETYNRINNIEHKYEECSICSDKLNIIFKNDIDGFVSEYASTTIEEDQAEVFAAWMSLENFEQFYKNNIKVLEKKKILKKKFYKYLNYEID